ncbi:MAG: outer membrane protein assembly factor BamD [Bacteroidaceae bacterium]|nr:outer membrane protein assembly factor BamD [Bacteroidaceae bacterium]
MNKLLRICLFTFSTLMLASCGEYAILQKTPDYEYKYEAAKAYFIQGKYSKASTLFYDLLGVMKGTANGEESLFMLSMSEYFGKNYDMAHNDLKKYCQSYPKGQYIEQARFYSAMSLYNQTPDPRLDQSGTVEAMGEFQAFLDQFPYTSLKQQTHEMIFALQDKLVEKECLSAQLYYDLGSYMINSLYGGSNYQACVVTAQNALRDYPYASTDKRERLAILILRAKYQLAVKSIEAKRIERLRDAIDEYYAFENDFPESKYLKEAKNILNQANSAVNRKHTDPGTGK